MSEIFPNKTWMNVKNAVKSWSWIRFQSISLPLLLNHLWCDLWKEWLYSGVQVYWTLTCHNFVPVFLLAICPAHFLFPELQLPSFFPPSSPWVSQSLSLDLCFRFSWFTGNDRDLKLEKTESERKKTLRIYGSQTTVIYAETAQGWHLQHTVQAINT